MASERLNDEPRFLAQSRSASEVERESDFRIEIARDSMARITLSLSYDTMCDAHTLRLTYALMRPFSARATRGIRTL